MDESNAIYEKHGLVLSLQMWHVVPEYCIFFKCSREIKASYHHEKQNDTIYQKIAEQARMIISPL